MMQTEGTRMTADDRRELERNIKELEKQIDDLKAFGYDKTIAEESERLNKELRRLRRMR